MLLCEGEFHGGMIYCSFTFHVHYRVWNNDVEGNSSLYSYGPFCWLPCLQQQHFHATYSVRPP